VTEMRFDPNAEAPRIYFRAVKRLNDGEREVVVEKGTSPEALAAIAFNPGSIDTGAAAPVPPKSSPFRDEAPQIETRQEPVREERTDPIQVEEAPAVFTQSAPIETVVEAAESSEPVIRRNTAKRQEPAAKVDMAKLVDEWDLDDE